MKIPIGLRNKTSILLDSVRQCNKHTTRQRPGNLKISLVTNKLRNLLTSFVLNLVQSKIHGRDDLILI